MAQRLRWGEKDKINIAQHETVLKEIRAHPNAKMNNISLNVFFPSTTSLLTAFSFNVLLSMLNFIFYSNTHCHCTSPGNDHYQHSQHQMWLDCKAEGQRDRCRNGCMVRWKEARRYAHVALQCPAGSWFDWHMGCFLISVCADAFFSDNMQFNQCQLTYCGISIVFLKCGLRKTK